MPGRGSTPVPEGENAHASMNLTNSPEISSNKQPEHLSPLGPSRSKVCNLSRLPPKRNELLFSRIFWSV